jgi:hypothetical protein
MNNMDKTDNYDEGQGAQVGTEIECPPDADEATRDAMFALSTHVAATMSIAEVQGQTISMPNDLRALTKELVRQSRTKGTGEEMLQTQAIVLDLVFNQLLAQAINQSDLQVLDSMLRLAFKAQTQCRSTLEAISDIRHPRITNNIAQLNNATGHQQVNNGTSARTRKTSRSKVDIKNPPNKLSEDLVSDILQNTGTSAGSEREDQPVAAVEESHRPKNSGG